MTEAATQTETPTAENSQGVTIEPGRLQYAMENLRGEQNLLLGLAGGSVAALVGAGVWAGLTVVTGYQIGWMAVGVGVLVGLAVRLLGKGIDKSFGIMGAALSLAGCAAGNLLAVCGMVASQEGIPLMQIVGNMNIGLAGEMMSATFSPIDLLFYGFAVYEGYRFSFRQLTHEVMARVLPELRSRAAA